jgi:hypothetical protein
LLYLTAVMPARVRGATVGGAPERIDPAPGSFLLG